MSKPFDASTKHLIETWPTDWLVLAGGPPLPCEVIGADLATVLAEADKVLRVQSEKPWILHLEMQASYDADFGERLLRYSVLLESRHRLPVQSVVVLLRPEADGPAMNGEIRRLNTGGECYHWFRYQVVRAWQTPVESLLSGGLGTLPLAPVAAVDERDLPAVISKMRTRLETEVPEHVRGELVSAAYLLMGLRFPPEMVQNLLKGAMNMRESSTYQVVLAEGRVEGRVQGRVEGRIEEARSLILRMGTKRFGEPSRAVRDYIESLVSAEALDSIAVRVIDVETWDELLNGERLQHQSAP